MLSPPPVPGKKVARGAEAIDLIVRRRDCADPPAGPVGRVEVAARDANQSQANSLSLESAAEAS